MAKKTAWTDQEIRDKKGRRYYLRYKRNKSDLTLTVRTQTGGRGVALAKVQTVVTDDQSIRDAIRKLNNKWRKFYHVGLTPAWEE